jgi:hypothetical protein
MCGATMQPSPLITLGAGAQATDAFSTVSERVYAQQQPIMRMGILSET